jgi:hypothetical protein
LFSLDSTTNILSLDMLRALFKDPKTLPHFDEAIRSRCLVAGSVLRPLATQIVEAWDQVATALSAANERTARQLTFSMARIYIASLLLEHASSQLPEDIYTAHHWVNRYPLFDPLLAASLTEDSAEVTATQQAMLFAKL